LEIIFTHHILRIYLRHRVTKVCILRWISLVTSYVSHPYKSTDSDIYTVLESANKVLSCVLYYSCTFGIIRYSKRSSCSTTPNC
jgi:hypothetical protein